MMNRVEMNEEMMELVNGGVEIPIVDQNEMLRIPERKTVVDDVLDGTLDTLKSILNLPLKLSILG